MIYNLLYTTGAVDEKFIPILYSDGKVEDIPLPLRSKTRYNPDSDESYDDLFRYLTKQPKIIVPPVGPLRIMPPAEASLSSVSAPGDQFDGHTSAWEQIQHDVFAYAQATDYKLPPILRIAVAPVTPVKPLTLSNELDKQFVLICRTLELPGHLARAPQCILYRAHDGDAQHAGRIYAWARGYGTIGVHLDIPCPITPVTGRLIDVLDLWSRTGRALQRIGTWPLGVFHSGTQLHYRLLLTGLSDAALKLDPAFGPVGNTLSPPTAGPNAYRNQFPYWDESGVWDAAQDVYDTLEPHLHSLARLLQCDWFEDRILMLRDVVKLSDQRPG